MSDKFVDDGAGLEFEFETPEGTITMTFVGPDDEGHVEDDHEEFMAEDEGTAVEKAAEGDSSTPGEPDEEHQTLTEAQRAAFRALSPERPLAEEARGRLERVLERVLARQGRRVVGAVRGRLDGLSKADEPILTPYEPEIVSVALGALGSWDFVIDGVSAALEDVAQDAVQQTIAVIGVDSTSELVDVVSERSVAMAEERAAELVGRRVLADGTIIDNPNPKWAISESTRTMIRERIQAVIRNNEGSDALIESLEKDHAFSPARAHMVARTEIADINSRAQMATYHAAQEAGVSLRKAWILGPKPCSVCRANAEEGPIPLEQTFQSGDDTTPAHPNCVCAVIPEVL